MSARRNTPKGARAYAQDMASFAFNTAMQKLRPANDGARASEWLDAMVDEFEAQILAMRAAAEPEAKSAASECPTCGPGCYR